MRRGEEDARRAGEFLRESNMIPDLAVASNARRAKQTLELALAAFALARVSEARESLASTAQSPAYARSRVAA